MVQLTAQDLLAPARRTIEFHRARNAYRKAGGCSDASHLRPRDASSFCQVALTNLSTGRDSWHASTGSAQEHHRLRSNSLPTSPQVDRVAKNLAASRRTGAADGISHFCDDGNLFFGHTMAVCGVVTGEFHEASVGGQHLSVSTDATHAQPSHVRPPRGHRLDHERRQRQCLSSTRTMSFDSSLQMSSCAEAQIFLGNCPGVKMDGDSDGIPCEDQWCSPWPLTGAGNHLASATPQPPTAYHLRGLCRRHPIAARLPVPQTLGVRLERSIL